MLTAALATKLAEMVASVLEELAALFSLKITTSTFLFCRHRDALTAALATSHAEVVASVLEELAARGGLDQVCV